MKQYEAFAEDEDGNIVYFASNELSEIESFVKEFEVYQIWDNEKNAPVA